MNVRTWPRKLREGRPAAAVLGLLCAAAFIWHASGATYTSTTVNPSNSFTAGTVTLGDDDSTTALVTVTGLKPGSTDTKCVVVTFTGSLASTVKVYSTASTYSGSAGAYINLTVDEGTGGSFAGGCTAFVSGTQIYSGTLANFAGTYTTFANGIGSFAPTTNGNTTVYRFSYSITDNDSAMGLTAGLGFTWEAQNT
jgi:hypothetical protein